jgi:hypothetical protein
MKNFLAHKTIYLTIWLGFFTFTGQVLTAENAYWRVDNEQAIVWDVFSETRLPHADDIEMAGQRVACILRYSADDNKQLSINRDLIFPQLRRFVRTSEPEWFNYRNYLRYTFSDEYMPVMISDQMILNPPLDSVRIDGKITFYHLPEHDILIQRTFFPSMTERLWVEKITLTNRGRDFKQILIGAKEYEHNEPGMHGHYTIRIHSDANTTVNIAPGESYTYGVYYSATMNDEPAVTESFARAEAKRDEFLAEMQQKLILKTPDPVINTLFYFSKIRAAENIFETKMGLVHSPGGGNYYAGVWANDQVEYSGPFFPYLGYENGKTAAYNAYVQFMKNIPPKGEFIKSSFEMEGDLPCCSKDRGDAAMIAYGTSQFVLALGDSKIAQELWPLIEWSLEYNHSKLNNHGVVMSDTDEMEGRIPTGDANLSTSSLYYGGLINGARVAAMLGKNIRIIREYNRRASNLENAIENHFGATIDGIETYRYFEGHETFRHWICLPLVMGINTRKEGTLKALFEKLWTDNGILVDPNENVLWDRGTLYAFRGAFFAGAQERALSRLTPFSHTRLLGARVPYVVEAYPEYGMRHLSAESALYCRIFTEGMLGIEPTSFNTFYFTPNISWEWEKLSLHNTHILGRNINFNCKTNGNMVEVEITDSDKLIWKGMVPMGKRVEIKI